MRIFVSILVLLVLVSLTFLGWRNFKINSDVDDYVIFFDKHKSYQSDGFQMPLNPPDAIGYYNAQFFGVNLHLGEDWNGVGGGNTDLGDPVYVISNGWVSGAEDLGGGWGNVVRVIHQVDSANNTVYIESVYAHLDEILVEAGDSLFIGEQIGTIGNANGAYWAHLHLEIRNKPGMPIGGGYSSQTQGYLIPTEFIKSNPKKEH